MDSNHIIDRLWILRNLLISRRQLSRQKHQRQGPGNKKCTKRFSLLNCSRRKSPNMTYSESTLTAEELTIGKEGAQLFRAVLSRTQLSELESALGTQPRDQAGVRLSGIPELRPLLSAAGPVGKIPASALGPDCLPVRAILFDKNVDRNWSLGWH